MVDSSSPHHLMNQQHRRAPQEHGDAAVRPLDESGRLPLVTVAIPVYQHADYVEHCLRSVAEQDYPRIELVVIDDGSSDGSSKLIEAFVNQQADRFERVDATARENRGLIATLDELVERSTGEIIIPIASDDALLPGSVARRVDLLESQPTKLAVFSDCEVIDEHGIVVAASGVADLHGGHLDALQYEPGLTTTMMLTWSIPGPCLSLRRTAFDVDSGIGSYADLGFPEDFDLFLRLSTRRAAWFTAEPLAQYRVHSASVSQQQPDLMKSGNRDTVVRLLDRFGRRERIVAQLIIAATSGRRLRAPIARVVLLALRTAWPPIAGRLGRRAMRSDHPGAHAPDHTGAAA